MQIESKKNFLINLAYIVTICAIIYFSFKFLAAYLLPFVIALFIAMIIKKPTKFLSEKTKIPKGICSIALVILSFIIIAGVFTLLCFLVYNIIAKIAGAVPGIVEALSGTIHTLGDSIESLTANLPNFAQNSVDDILSNLIAEAGKFVTDWLPKIAGGVATKTPEFIIFTIVTIVASCYISRDYDRLKGFVKRFIAPKYVELVREIKDIASTNVLKMLKSYIMIMGITFVELSISLLVLGVKNAFLIALLISFVDILPVLGCGTVLIPWGIVGIVQGNYFIGIGVLLTYIIILIVRNIIEPKIIGDQVGLHPLVTLIAIFVGLKFLGVIGVFLLPIITIIFVHLYRRGKLDFIGFNAKTDE